MAEIDNETIQLEVFIDRRLLNQYKGDSITINAKTWKFLNWQRSTLFLESKK